MKSQLLILLLTIALTTSLVSATSVFPVEVVGTNSNIYAGEIFEIKFKLNNNLPDQNISKILIGFSEKLASGLQIGKLKSIKYGTSTFSVSPINFNGQILSGAILEDVKVLNKTTSSEFFILTIESNTSLLSDTYSTSIQLKAKNDAGEDVEIAPLPISFKILPEPIIRINEIRKLMLNQTGILNISNIGNANIGVLTLSATGAALVFSNNNFNLNIGSSKAIEVSLSDTSQIPIGNTEIVINAKDANNPNFQSSYKFILTKSFCKFGPAGANLSISNIDITNEDGDENEWMPLDNVEIKVEVENNGQSDINDVVVELGLFDNTGKNVANKLKYSNTDENKIKLGRINDGDEERATFSFVVPADLNSGSYKLAIKAYSRKTGENVDCTDRSSDLDNQVYQSIRIDKEDDEGKFISFDNIRLSSSTANCGETLTLSANVYNIGDEDQDRVKVTLSNKDLKIDVSQEIINLDSGEGKPIIFTFAIPQGVTDKSYNLELSASYDYNNGVYRESLDESSKIILRVIGCAIQSIEKKEEVKIKKVSVDSQAIAGGTIKVSAEIQNNGNQQKTLIVSAEGYDSWAKIQKISEPLLTLNAGATKSVDFNFNINNAVSGKKTFTIKISDGTNVLQSEEFDIDIAKKSSGFLNNSINLSNSQLLWILGIINVILIILIIIAVLRITRR